MFENITHTLGLGKPKGEPDGGGRKVEAKPAKPVPRPVTREPVQATPLKIGEQRVVAGTAVPPSQSSEAVRADVTPDAPGVPVKQEGPIPSNLSDATRAVAELFVGDRRSYASWNETPQPLRLSLIALGEWDSNPYGGFQVVSEGLTGWSNIISHLETILAELATGHALETTIEMGRETGVFNKYVAQILGVYLIKILMDNSYISSLMKNYYTDGLTNIGAFKNTHGSTYKALEDLGAFLKKPENSTVRDQVQVLIQKLPGWINLNPLFKQTGIS